jgi:hypothetical protein
LQRDGKIARLLRAPIGKGGRGMGTETAGKLAYTGKKQHHQHRANNEQRPAAHLAKFGLISRRWLSMGGRL